MMYLFKRRYVYLMFILIFSSCAQDESPARFPAGKVAGFRPIYGTEADLDIKSLGAQSLVDPGKIYVYGDILLVNERRKGVHIINNVDPTDPKSVGFIKILGNVDMALKGNILYVDHISDLVALDVSDISNIVEVDRVEGVYEKSLPVPPRRGFYFECVDKAKANLVIGWAEVQLDNPECYR